MNIIVGNNLLPVRNNFLQSIEGKQTDLFILTNKGHMQAALTNYGGRLVSLLIPDKEGKQRDVIVGPDSIEGFKSSTEPYFGATIGRYGNRIAKGKFTLDGQEYNLYKNDGLNTLHGGKRGFQDVVWDA